MRRSRTLLPAALALALLVAGATACGEDEGGSVPQTGNPPTTAGQTTTTGADATGGSGTTDPM